MGILTIQIEDKVETLLREHIRRRYLRSHGKLREIVEKAILQYLGEGDAGGGWQPSSYVENLERGRHVVMFYRDPEYAREIESGFITRGLSKGASCVYVMPEGDRETPQSIENQMRKHGVESNGAPSEKRLHILSVPNPMSDPEGPAKAMRKTLKSIRAKFEPPYDIVIHMLPKVETEKEKQAHIELEHTYHLSSRNLPGSSICNLYIGGMTRETHAEWMTEMLANHHAAIFALQGKGVALDLHAGLR